MKGVKSFFGHAGFYRRFIKYFSKITNPLCKLLEKEVKFYYNDKCLTSFKLLKQKLVASHIMITLDRSKPFELLCDTTRGELGAILDQNKQRMFH